MATIYDDGREYDSLGRNVATGEEIGFYTSQALQGDSTLELACGTGRLTIPLAQAGFKIVGIDMAPSMLEVARIKAAGSEARPSFVEADVRNFSLEQCFDRVLFPNNSLSHLHGLSDIQACFACVRQHLSVEGRFLVDMFNPSLSLLMRVAGKHYPVAEYKTPDGEQVVVTETVNYDAATQINHILWHYHREGKPDNVRPLDMRVFFPQELDALLMLSGFIVEAKYGDYNETPFSGGARQQLIVCRKANRRAA